MPPDEVLCIPRRFEAHSQTLVEKLFGKSERVANRDSEGRQEGAKEPRSAAPCRQRRTVEKRSAIFQTVSEGEICETRLSSFLDLDELHLFDVDAHESSCVAEVGDVGEGRLAFRARERLSHRV